MPSEPAGNTVKVLGGNTNCRKEIEIYGFKRTKIGYQQTKQFPEFLDFVEYEEMLTNYKIRKTCSLPNVVNKITNLSNNETNLMQQKTIGFQENAFRTSLKALSACEIQSIANSYHRHGFHLNVQKNIDRPILRQIR